MLRVAPGASDEEIRLAYDLILEVPPRERGTSQAEIERAFSILGNPATRRIYDRAQAGPAHGRRRPGPSRLHDWRILATCLVLLVGILAFVWLPLFGSRFRSFSAGDRLVDVRGAEFGVVVSFEDRHAFPGGKVSPAYLVETAPTKELRWFPAPDLQGACHTAE